MPANDPREIELKLELDPSDVAALKTGLLPKLCKGGTSENLVSVYYDTPKQVLRANGMSLRVRSIGERRVQTVKAAVNGHAGLFDRSEWESDIEGDRPDMGAAAKSPLKSVLRKRRAGLAPVFETVIERTTWMVETKRSAIEVSLDEGKVSANGSAQPLVELEFELKRGPSSELFKLVRKLKTVRSLRTAVLAKSDRGYALLDGHKGQVFRAEPLILRPDMGSGEAFQTIMHACIKQFRLNEGALIGARAPEALHQARVAMRRLRSALSLFKPLVSDERFLHFRSALRDASHKLGEARNLDVYLDRSARPEAERESGALDVSDFIDTMEARRTAAYDGVVALLRAKPFRRLMLDLVEWIETGPWLLDDDAMQTMRRDRPVQGFAADSLDRARSKVRKKGRKLAGLDPRARHRLRIDAKKLRYASEFFAGLARGRKERERHETFIDALERLQEHLGDLNDIDTGHTIAVGFAAPDGLPEGHSPPAAIFAAAHVSGEQDLRVEDLLRAASAAHGKLRKAKPFWSRWINDPAQVAP